MPDNLAFLAAHRAELIQQLAEWLRVPSVAGLPEHEIDVLRSANWLAGTLRRTGFPTVEVWGTAVYAEWRAAPGAPTVLVYSHHDVRAAKDEEWKETAPFEPVERDGHVYGRGASDAKGQVLAHVWGLRAHVAEAGAPAVTIKLLVEGEEETGSAGLSALIEANRDRLGADLVVFSDTLLWHRDHPAVCTSMRGMILARLEVRGPLRDMHSGAVSGPAPNPLIELGRLLGSLHDEKGRITLPGFYDDVAEPTARRRAELAALPYSDEDWLSRSATRTIGGEHGWTTLERLWLRPQAEVISMIGGDPVGPSRGAVPSQAEATLSIRIVPDQTPSAVADQLHRWVAQTLSDRVDYQLTISEETGQKPYATPPGHPAVDALAAAMEDGFGTPAGRMSDAGGGPAELLARLIEASVLYFGTGLPEDRWHDSDERTSVDVLLAGAATLASFWSRLAKLPPESLKGPAQ
ncbi:M20/M25/M40 family metallo-hydrolase [Paractinoplanes atraurantiacus]|uniref:Acetylornithine deacetylase/Succinyl-diaminopimelate desuccinylase n=1 Tax=Paractinoplanes atraurantiacus TaxID=1036182 RepID=A0A285J2H9_9ACTN|nr:M20/M25/M40 family metallo-hydrolase [Actinoplanes atraurantiacus]SNY54545.1 Acetylornithine deacetylase/Succinyl-diaminopimelate desuccinylase [Actinoplanes atraurantiacus]